MTTTTTTTKPFKAPSDRQIAFVTDLTRDREVPGFPDAARALARLTVWFAREKRSSKDVSDMIDRLLKLPKRSLSPMPAPAPTMAAPIPFKPVPEIVPSSKFAILTELLTEAPDAWKRQEYLFFEVKKLPRKSNRVISRLTGAPGRFNRTHLPYALRAELLGHLEDEAFAYQASLTFAEIYQVCGRCAAELTDTDSRERKFGLTCWNLMAPYRAKAFAATA